MTLTVSREAERANARPRIRYKRALPACAAAIDLGIILIAYVAAEEGRDLLPFISAATSVASLTVAGPVIVSLWMITLAMVGSYRLDDLGVGTIEFRRMLAASAGAAAAVGIACYVTSFELSRGFFLLLFAVGTPGLIVGRMALRHAIKRARANGQLLRTVLISGTPDHVDELTAVLDRESWLGYRVVGALTPTTSERPHTPGGVEVLGRSADVLATVDAVRPDVLFFADSSVTNSEDMRQAVWQLESYHTQIMVAPSVTNISAERVKMLPIGGLPLIQIEKPRTVAASRWAKRTFDVCGAVALLGLFTPLFLACAVRVWIHDRGPILYRQARVGRGGHLFDCVKFRTMVMNSERLQQQLMEHHGSGGLLFKLKDDPRVTRPGRWMRRYSLDELPQLLNVVSGDMSLVGPRPQLPSEVALYEGDMQRRLLVRPGMTGLWQVSGRSDLSVEEAIRLDLYYVDNWSMVQDLTILARTLGAVTSARGAY